MIARFLLCLSLWMASCAAAPTAGFGQDSGSLAEGDQDFKKAMEIWGNGRSPEAEALLNRALSIRQRSLGPDDPKIAEAIRWLGALNFNRRKTVEAEALFRKALDIDVRAIGEKSLPVAYLMGDIGAALREQGRYNEAQAIVEQPVVLRRALLPPNDQGIAGGLNNLGRIYLGEHRYPDAQRVLQELLQIYASTVPAADSRVVQGQALLKQADSAEQAAGRLVKIFDVQDSGFRDWTFPAFGLLFVVIGLFILVFPNLIRAVGIPYLNLQSGLQKSFPYVFVGFAVIWTAIAFFTTYSAYLRHRALVVEGRCNSVEGPVEHFVPMPYAGHAQESFSVAGVPFRYSDFIITDGFNNTSSHGGPIHGDSVRPYLLRSNRRGHPAPRDQGF